MMRLLLLALLCVPFASAQLRVGFYNSSCPQAESIVQAVVRRHSIANPSTAAQLLRMYFHDCFVHGCDASLLVEPTPTHKSEKQGFPNTGLRGYGIVADAKSELEALCPSTVSCADVIALATRDSVALAGGFSYDVPTGRRDGLASSPEEANHGLPSPAADVAKTEEMFAAEGFGLEEMVVLMGAHTVGFAHCGLVRKEGEMDALLKGILASTCSRDKQAPLFLDQITPFIVDNKYYSGILANKGVMAIDHLLSTNSTTAAIAQRLASDADLFHKQFVAALVKLGNLGVLVGTEGEIRKTCHAFNNPQ